MFFLQPVSEALCGAKPPARAKTGAVPAKAKAGGKGKGNALAAETVVDDGSLPDEYATMGVNTEYLQKVNLWMDTMKTNSTLAEVMKPDCAPLRLQDGARIALFNKQEFTNALKAMTPWLWKESRNL